MGDDVQSDFTSILYPSSLRYFNTAVLYNPYRTVIMSLSCTFACANAYAQRWSWDLGRAKSFLYPLVSYLVNVFPPPHWITIFL